MGAIAERDRAARHLQLLTETIAAVNSTLDLAEVFAQIASKVAQAMSTDACFVYLYDEASGMLELRATHGARFDDPAHRPRMAPGEGITGAAAAASVRPVAIDAGGASRSPLPVLPQPARGRVRVDPGGAGAGPDKLAGALNVRTRAAARVRRRRDRAAVGDRRPGRAGDRERQAVRALAARVAELEALADIGAHRLLLALPGRGAARDLRAHAAGARRRWCARGAGDR